MQYKNNIDNNKLVRWAAAGIITDVLYFAAVSMFIATKTDISLTVWELMTVVGAFVMLMALSCFADGYNIGHEHRTYMLISLSGTLFLTSTAHFTSIGVVRRLISQGADIPDYFRIGMFPSLEMTVDYTAWGLFMGCAFLAISLGIVEARLKVISMICAILCFTGFIGSFFLEALWYPAPLGYGAGFLVMCIYILVSKKQSRAMPI